MSVLLGLNAKLYYWEGAGAPPTPTPGAPPAPPTLTIAEATTDWKELLNMTNATIDFSKAEADITTRGSGGFRAKVGTLKEGAISFQMLEDDTDPDFQLFANTFFDDSAERLTILALNQDPALTTGLIRVSGIYADFDILSFSKSEELEDAQRYDVGISVTTGGRLSLLPQQPTPIEIV